MSDQPFLTPKSGDSHSQSFKLCRIPRNASPRKAVARDRPAISDAQARKLFDATVVTTLQGLRDRAILSVFLFHGVRQAEGAGLKVGSLADRRGVPYFTIRGKRSKVRYLPGHPSP